MRRIFTFILVAILNLSLFAQINRTDAQVHLEEPGTLSAKLKEQGIIFGSINKLIVTGKFNQRDFSSMKMQMTNLQYVDISGTDITEIPSEAMRGKSQLTHFYAPVSVRKIGQYAFYGCSNLQNLPFEPASIDTIQNEAFQSCSSMRGDLNFSEKLRYLGSSAFSSTGVEHVDLSKCSHLNYLNSYQFSSCSSLTLVLLSPSLNQISYGVFSYCSSLQEIDLSVCENLTSIDSDCFNSCSSLRKVILPESMRQIYTPFQSCNNLREIVVKSTIAPSIQEMTFGSVNWDEAKLFVPIGSKETYEKAQHWNLFYDIFEIGLMVKHNPGGIVKQDGEAVPNNKIVYHDAKETIFEFIPQDGYEVRSIRFKGQEQTPSNQFTVPAGTENAVVDVEFALKKFDVDVTISGQGSVKWEGAEVLTGTSVAIDSSAMARFIIRPEKGYILNELTFNGEVNIVQQDSVYVTPMILHGSVLNIQFASEAEVGAAHKLHFTIGENGRVDYMNTPLLPATTISVKEGEPAVFTFYPAATYRLAKVMLDSEDVTAQVENNQLTLSSVTKESNVTVSFEIDPVSVLHVQTRGTLSQVLGKHQYAVVTDLTLSGELNEQDIYLLRDSVKLLTNLDLSKAQLFTYSENGVLCDRAFDGKAKLKSVVLPADLKDIREKAFNNCKVLDSINIKDLNQLTTIGDYAFAYTGFQSLVFPEKAINWGSYVLDGVNKLTTVVLPKSIRQIPAYSFNACNSLKSVNLSELTALESIGSYAFQSCSDLSALTIPAGVKQIGSYAFSMCQRLVEAHILAETPPALSDGIFDSYLALLFVPEQSVSAYKTASYWSGYNVISRDSKPVTVHVGSPGTLAASLTNQGCQLSDVFNLTITGNLNAEDFRIMNKSMPSLIEVDMSGSEVREIPANAFDGKSKLKRFVAPKGIRVIGSNAFKGCQILENIPFGDSIQTIGSNAFYNCMNMAGEITFPESLTQLDSEVFRSCYKLTKVDFSKADRISSIPSYCFQSSGVKDIVWNKNIQYISPYAFEYTKVEKVDLSACVNLYSIEYNAFSGCSNLKTVILPNSNSLSISSNVFTSSSINSIVCLSSHTPSIQESTFSGVDYNRCVLYVPTGSAKTYGLTSIWATFTKIEEIGVQVLIGKNGSILYEGNRLADKMVIFNDSLDRKFTIQPNPGYEVDSLWLNNKLLAKDSKEVIIEKGMRAATLKAKFVIKKFNVAVNISGEGSVKLDNNVVTDGMVIPLDSASMAQFIIHPAKGYILNELTFNGEVNIVQQDSVYVTPMIQHASVLNIQFASEAEVGAAHKLHFTIGENGRVDYTNTPLLPATTISVKEGEPAVFTFYPAATYRLAKVMLDTEDVTVQVENNQLTLSNVTKESNVAVSFEIDPVVSLKEVQKGMLQSLIASHQYPVVKELTLTGELNEQDFMFIRSNLTKLSKLDLSASQLYSNHERDVLCENALSGRDTLRTVILPAELKRISACAFRNCYRLDSVNISELTKLTTIGDNAFEGAALSDLVIPASVKNIGTSAFYGCKLVKATVLGIEPPVITGGIFDSNLTLLLVPSESVAAYKTASHWSGYNVISLESKPAVVHVATAGSLASSLDNQGYQLSDVFNLTITGDLNAEDFRIMNKSMPSLIEIDMSGSEVREIPDFAFDGKSRLKSIELPKNLKKIGSKAFNECSILEKVTLGDSIQSIGSMAFKNCSNMRGELKLPAALKSVGSEAFRSTRIEGELLFPESFTSLSSNAFDGCSAITKVDFSKSKGLSYIDSYAFQNCSQLATLILSDNINQISNEAFASTNLKEVVWSKNLSTISSQAFYNTDLETVDLSGCRRLNNIEYSAFSSCYQLKKVVLPDTEYLSLSNSAFSGSSLTSIVSLSSRTPSIQESTFSGVDYNRCVLYVPTGSAKTYGLTSIWATFTKIEEIGVQVLIGQNGSVLYEGNRLADKTVLFGEANPYTFQVMPEPGYVTDSLWVDYQLMDKDLTEVIIPAGTRKATVKAKFALKKFGLRIQIEGEGQVKMADRLLANGETVALDSCSMLPLIMLPAEGFDADTIRFNEMPCVLQRDSVFMTPQMEKPSDLLIRFVAKSEKGTMHRISTTARKNGRIEYCNTPLMTLSSVKVKEGEQAEFTFIGEKGYLVDRVWLNGKDVTAMLNGNKLLTPAIQSAIELEASYKVNPLMVVESKYPGQLEGFFNTDQKKGVSNLKLKGALNSTDFNFLRDSMEVLSVLDLREARVGESGAYGEAYYTDEIPSYAFYNNSKGKKTLTEVYLSKETKLIGSGAFQDASNLSMINWLELTALESIQHAAFYMSGIKEVALSESVKELGSSAFSHSKRLVKVDLSRTQLKIIPENLFYFCQNLVDVRLSGSIVDLKEQAFYSANALKTINLGECKQLRTIGYYAFYDTALDTLRLPASVKDIGTSAFSSNSSLKKVDLSNLVDLKVLPASIFSSCSNLTNVVLPPNVITIENDAFSGSALSGTLQLPETVTNIGDNAFSAGSLKFCKLTVTTPPVIGNNIFNSGTLIGVFVPESAVAAYESNERWGQYLILGGERRVTVHVDRGGELAQQIMDQAKVSPATVTHLTVTGTLNEADFGGIRTNMTVLYNLDLSQTDVTYLPNGAFRDKRILMNVQLPDGLQEIGANAFMNCRGLQDTLTIPGGVTRIGDNAFQNCSDLHRVELPESLRQIGSYAFEYCSRLTQEIVFPRGVREIGYQAFKGCSNLYGTIEFSESLTSLSSYAFEGCSKVERVDLSKATQLYSINDHCFNGNSALKEVIFPKELRSIYSYAFQGCSKLDNLVFPQTLQTIGSYAFAYNTSLTQLDLSKSNQCYQISEYAFQNCKSLQTVNFPIALSSVGTRAFAGCDRLANISASNPNPATMYDNVFDGVKTRSCVLSIPTMSYYKYLTAEQWGQFVQMRKAIDVGVSKGGSVEYFAVSAEDPVNPSPIKVRAQDGTETDKGAILADASTIYVDEAEQIRFVINPEIANGTMKVLYNNVDVTNQMQGNVFVANQITEERGQLVVNFDIESEINIAVRAQNGGTVSGGGIAVYGEMVLVKAIPQFGYKFVKWTHNGVEVSRDAEYSFKAIQSLELEAQFVQFVSQLGDANGDNRVNISDVVTTVDYIIGKNPQAFIFEAADVNQDNRVNISDVVAIVDLILNPSGTKAASFDNGSSLATISGMNNQFIIESEKPVYGIEFAYDGEVEALDCLSGFQVTFFERDGETRVLAYSMNKGLTGKNAMFRFSPKAKVNDLIVVDKKGNEFELSGAFEDMAGSEEIEIRIENDYLKANSKYTVKRIEIYDMSGRIILNGNSNELNIQTLKRSTYVIRVVDEVRESRMKMIIGNNR